MSKDNNVSIELELQSEEFKKDVEKAVVELGKISKALDKEAKEANKSADKIVESTEDIAKATKELGKEVEKQPGIFSRFASGLKSNLKKVGSDFREAGGQVKSFGSAIAKTGGAIKGLLFNKLTGSIAALGGAFGVATVQSLGFIDSIAKQAQLVNLGVEEFQKYKFAFGNFGVAQDQTVDGLRTLNSALGQFIKDGGGPAAVALEQLGIQAKDAFGNIRSNEDILDEVFNKLGRIEDGSIRSGVAIQLFGETAGNKFAAALANGSGAIDELKDKAVDLGLVIGQDTATKSENATQALSDLKDVIKTQLSLAFAQNAEQIEKWARNAAVWVPGVIKIFSAFIGDMYRIFTNVPEILQASVAQLKVWVAQVDLQVVEAGAKFRGFFLDAVTAVRLGFNKIITETQIKGIEFLNVFNKINPFAKEKTDEDLNQIRESLRARADVIREAGNAEKEAQLEVFQERADAIRSIIDENNDIKTRLFPELNTPEAIEELAENLASRNETVNEAEEEATAQEVERTEKKGAFVLQKTQAQIKQEQADIKAANDKKKKEQEEIDNALINLQEIFGERSEKIGKAITIAQATRSISNAIIGAVEAAQKAGPFPANLAAIATGIAAVGAATAGPLAAIKGARQDGGPVTAGDRFLVGEKGPEIFTPAVNGAIIPNNQIGSNRIEVVVTGNDEITKQFNYSIRNDNDLGTIVKA